jgi:hypothetical protein
MVDPPSTFNVRACHSIYFGTTDDELKNDISPWQESPAANRTVPLNQRVINRDGAHILMSKTLMKRTAFSKALSRDSAWDGVFPSLISEVPEEEMSRDTGQHVVLFWNEGAMLMKYHVLVDENLAIPDAVQIYRVLPNDSHYRYQKQTGSGGSTPNRICILICILNRTFGKVTSSFSHLQ